MTGFVRVLESFGKLWKSEIFFPGPGKFWKKMCYGHWAMEKFWIFSRPLRLERERRFYSCQLVKNTKFFESPFAKMSTGIFLADLPIRAHVATVAYLM